MDRIDPVATTSPAEPSAARAGIGSEFRAVAQGTSTERRRRSLGGRVRAGRGLPAAQATAASADSGTWRLAL